MPARGSPYTRAVDLPLPLSLRHRIDEFRERLQRIPTNLNEYGYDPFGLDVSYFEEYAPLFVLGYDLYHRVEVTGIENVPEGPVLLVGNHAGNTLPMDAFAVITAMILEAEPPRIPRGMAESYLPRIPFWNQLVYRGGAVVGTPENCLRLLRSGECILVFPEGSRGFIKPHSQAYQLQSFGQGFARLALEAGAPVVPIGIVGSEEQSPGLLDSKKLARLFGTPAFPVTWGFPWLGLLGYIPMPVKYRLHFGKPILLKGDANDEDEALEEQVQIVKDEIRNLIERGLHERSGWFR